MAQQSSDSSGRVGYTVAPHIFSQITLRVPPNAACTVRLEGSTDPMCSLKVHADPSGIARLHVRPLNETEELFKFDVECEVDQQVTHSVLELRACHEPSHDMPAPPEDDLILADRTTSMRPALSEREMVTMSHAELLERGYPVRPDPDEVPRAFRAWRQAVAVPMEVVDAYLIDLPDVQHGKGVGLREAAASSFNWSGYELLRSLVRKPAVRIGQTGISLDEPYDWVHGRWHVPAAYGELNRRTYSSLWVGLDGDGTTDLVQAGTESDSIRVGDQYMSIMLSTYSAWVEFLPQQPTSQLVSNFPVSPGDDILVEVWIGEAGSGPTLSGRFGVFLIMNLTTQLTTRIYTTVDATHVGGTEAVWILERPTILVPASGIFGAFNQLPDLANYGSAVMFDAYARKANSPRNQGYVPYLGPRNKAIAMVDGTSGRTLSTVTPIDSYSMRFLWAAFN